MKTIFYFRNARIICLQILLSKFEDGFAIEIRLKSIVFPSTPAVSTQKPTPDAPIPRMRHTLPVTSSASVNIQMLRYLMLMSA